MDQNDIDEIISLREGIISDYSRIKDYKLNKNALMKEVEHAQALHEIIVKIDNILEKYVSFA